MRLLSLNVDDSEAIAALYQQLPHDLNLPKWCAKDFYDFLSHPHHVGWGIYNDQHTLHSFLLAIHLDHEAEIILLATAKSYQGQGHARKLIENLKHMTASIQLEVAANNQSALIFYQRRGFKQFAIRKHYYKSQIDALCFHWQKETV